MEKVYLSLPFYGKAGTISRILETEEEFIRLEYDLNGKEKKDRFPVPKNKRSHHQLMNNFYQDVQGYLNSNENYYRDCKEKRLKKEINFQKVQLGKYIAAGMAVLSIPLCFSNVMLFSYFNIIIAASSISCFVATLDLTKKYQNDQKRASFIKEFDQYNKNLNTYRVEQEKGRIKNPTKFYGLSEEKTKGNNLNHKKVLSLEAKNHTVGRVA